MDDKTPPELIITTSDAAERSLVDDLRELADNGRTLVEAEVAYQKSRAAVAGSGVKSAAIFGALAAALVFFALMALTVGLLLGLVPVIGPWGATAAVTIALLIGALFAARTAARRWSATAAVLNPGDPA